MHKIALNKFILFSNNMGNIIIKNAKLHLHKAKIHDLVYSLNA